MRYKDPENPHKFRNYLYHQVVQMSIEIWRGYEIFYGTVSGQFFAKKHHFAHSSDRQCLTSLFTIGYKIIYSCGLAFE